MLVLEADEVEKWRATINDQLTSTAQYTSLAEHRDLVSNRWGQVLAFSGKGGSPSKLSPKSRELKSSLFNAGLGELDAGSFTGYKKRHAAMMQGLSNAHGRLVDLHKEEVAATAVAGNLTKNWGPCEFQRS